MNSSLLIYFIFSALIILALIFDLGLLSKKGTSITIPKALAQTSFWVCLAMVFFGFLWYEKGHVSAFEYLSAYLMEWSLSIDNIFIFIILFSFFSVKEQYYGRVLLIGIMMAVILRIIFITVGVVLVAGFHWLLYIFGAILIYTGISMFLADHDHQVNLQENKIYKFLKRFFPLTPNDGNGEITIIENGKKLYTSIFAVIILIATTDLIFAIDSIPAVFGITQDRLVIYTSNIFAVLGLRSLFFLLRGAVNKFRYLPQGIAIVLVFIGIKMLIEMFKIVLPVYVSLGVIVFCIGIGILFSTVKQRS